MKPDLREAYDDRLQDWGTWLQEGIVDVVCPMAYTPEAARFARADFVGSCRCERPPDLGRHRRVPPLAAQTVDNIQTARRHSAPPASSCSRTTA